MINTSFHFSIGSIRSFEVFPLPDGDSVQLLELSARVPVYAVSSRIEWRL